MNANTVVGVGILIIGVALVVLLLLPSSRSTHTGPMEVTKEELEKTKLILDFAERNCKKLGFRVEGAGAYITVTCGKYQ